MKTIRKSDITRMLNARGMNIDQLATYSIDSLKELGFKDEHIQKIKEMLITEKTKPEEGNTVIESPAHIDNKTLMLFYAAYFAAAYRSKADVEDGVDIALFGNQLKLIDPRFTFGTIPLSTVLGDYRSKWFRIDKEHRLVKARFTRKILKDINSEGSTHSISDKLTIKTTIEREKKRGKIFFIKNNYGFITNPLGKTIFFHGSELQNCKITDLIPGDEVEFIEGLGPKGSLAVKIVLIPSPSAKP